jgi:hypothetical protein
LYQAGISTYKTALVLYQFYAYVLNKRDGDKLQKVLELVSISLLSAGPLTSRVTLW